MVKSTDEYTPDWEDLCCKCGRCCFEKIDFEGAIYYTGIPCQYLDTKTNLCRVYAKRDSRRPGCVRLTRENVPKGFLPADCPYVRGLNNYPAPIMPVDCDRDDL